MGAEAVSDKTLKALQSAAASSAMEGLALDDEKLDVIAKILNSELTLQSYLESLKLQEQGN